MMIAVQRISSSCLLLCLCSVAAGQIATLSPAETAESKTVAELMASREPARLAWGAHLAGNYRLSAFAGDLLRLASDSDWRVRMAAIDSLIRLDIAIPEDVLTRMAENRLDEVLIVIARKPSQYSQLIQRLLHQELENHYWVALNSILTTWPPDGFAATLLREWTVRLTVTVRDPNTGGGVSGGVGVGDGGGFAQTGFPPLEAYYVIENPQPGDVLLANGPHPVFYRKQSGHYRVFSSLDRDAYRRDYLVHLAQLSSSETTWFSSQTTNASIDWKPEAELRAVVKDMFRRISSSVDYLKMRLVDRKLLALAESNQFNPSFDVRVIDRRQVQIPPLPAVDWVLAVEENGR